MKNLTKLRQILSFSMALEKKGESFYRNIRKQFHDTESLDLFTRLADEEARHYHFFKELLAQFSKKIPVKDSIKKTPAGFDDVFSATPDPDSSFTDLINFSIEQEAISIAYYQKFNDFIFEEFDKKSKNKHDAFNDALVLWKSEKLQSIISEEENHIGNLKAMANHGTPLTFRRIVAV